MRRFWAIVLLAFSLTWAGCSSDVKVVGPDGNELDNVAEQLVQIENVWRDYRTEQEVVSNFGEDTRCYLKVEADGDQQKAGEQVLCGPYRLMAAETTSWDVAPITFNDGVLELDPSGFTATSSLPGGGWWADGKAPNENAEVNEPDAPAIEFGETVIPGSANPPEITKADSIITPDGSYTVWVGRSERIGGPKDRKMVVDGSFVTVKVEREAALDSNYENVPRETKLAVKSGDQIYEVPIYESYFSMAVPGDGEDATVQFIFDSMTQELSTDGKRLDAPNADLLYQENQFFKVDQTEAKIGGSYQDGWFFKAGLQDAKASLKPWIADEGWAEEGKAWLVIEGKLKLDGPKYFVGNQQAKYLKNNRYILGNVTLGDTEAVVQEIGELDLSSAAPVTFAFEVPSDYSQDRDLTFSIKATGKKSEGSPGNAPKEADLSLLMTTKVHD